MKQFFHNFFDIEGGFFRFFSRAADLVILNVIFLICCLPLITIGAALSSLFTITLQMWEERECYIVRSFLNAMKKNFKKATLLWLIALVPGAVLLTDWLILSSYSGSFALPLLVAATIAAFLYGMFFLYLFPLQARFENRISATLKNALIFTIAYLPSSLILLALFWIPVLLTFWNAAVFSQALLFWLMIGFALLAYLQSFFLQRIFSRYIPAGKEK